MIRLDKTFQEFFLGWSRTRRCLWTPCATSPARPPPYFPGFTYRLFQLAFANVSSPASSDAVHLLASVHAALLSMMKKSVLVCMLVCAGLCAGVCAGVLVCVLMCAGLSAGLCAGVCAGVLVCVLVCAGLCAGVCTSVCVGVCAGLCAGVCWCVTHFGGSKIQM